MKRLLAYLFIVLGLGLTFNVNANSVKDELANTAWKLNDSANHIIFLENNTCLYTMDIKALIKKSYYNKSACTWKNIKGKKYSIKVNKSIYEIKVKKNSFRGKSGSGYNLSIRAKKKTFIRKSTVSKIKFLKSKETQIAKAEPSQTQKVATKVANSIKNSDKFKGIICGEEPWDQPGKYIQIFIFADKNKSCESINQTVHINYNKYLDILNDPESYDAKYGHFIYSIKKKICLNKKSFLINNLSTNCSNNETEVFVTGGSGIKIYLSSNKKIKTQIAKAEPSQTQKVVKKEVTWEVYAKVINNLGTNAVLGPINFKKSLKIKNDSEQYGLFKEVVNAALQKCDNRYRGKYYEAVSKFGKCVISIIKYNETNDPSKNIKLVNASGISIDEIEIDWNGIKNQETQIAKVEPTVKPKKKVKVAKVEPKQEEFKPKKTNQDNEAPVITIAEAITVNDSSYEFQGKVTDKAKTIYVEVDGRLVDVNKKGQFVVKGYSPIDKEISITAFDQWGNRSEPKIVKLTIDIKDTNVAEKLEPLNPSKIRSKSSNNKIALIIGIENYSEAPKANYANLDAKYFFDYARKAFGVKKQNINLLVNEEATVVKTDKALSLWLKSKIKKDKSELIIFFAGHGLASTDGKELYLLPQDGNPDRLERTAISRTDLFKEIISLSPKSVTMFLDTCYSGVSRDEQMLLASARPIRIVADEQESIPDNFTIFSASQLDQISSGFKEAKHGIFSYYLMKGLEGKADENKDYKITNGELLAYMDKNVSQKAAEQGRQQNPSLAGDPDKILMSYR